MSMLSSAKTWSTSSSLKEKVGKVFKKESSVWKNLSSSSSSKALPIASSINSCFMLFASIFCSKFCIVCWKFSTLNWNNEKKFGHFKSSGHFNQNKLTTGHPRFAFLKRQILLVRLLSLESRIKICHIGHNVSGSRKHFINEFIANYTVVGVELESISLGKLCFFRSRNIYVYWVFHKIELQQFRYDSFECSETIAEMLHLGEWY